jgi:hypothetical protein
MRVTDYAALRISPKIGATSIEDLDDRSSGKEIPEPYLG